MTEKQPVKPKFKTSKELTDYCKSVNKITIDIRNNNEPDKKIFLKQKLRRFSYFASYSRHTITEPTQIVKDDWGRLEWGIVYHIKATNLYKKLERELIEADLNNYPSLEPLTKKVVSLSMQNKLVGINSISNIVKNHLNQQKNKPFKVKLMAELTGIALEPAEVIINASTKLRRITKKDLEREISSEKFEEFRWSVLEQSTSVFEVEYECENENRIFSDKTQFLNVLMLYKVGNVQSNSFAWQSSGTAGLGILHDEPLFFSHVYAGVSSYIRKKEINEFKEFWKVIKPKIPREFTLPSIHSKPVSIAYAHYRDGMEAHGHIEKRCAYGIMALEALLMQGENEIRYRIGMRVAQLLSILGLDKKKVFDDIGTAYCARSKFAHGGKLSSKELNKIKKKYKHNEVLELTILDYVRILIVSLLLIKYVKSDLLKLIDESWLIESRFKKLEMVLRKPKKLLSLSDYEPKYTPMLTNKKNSDYVI